MQGNRYNRWRLTSRAHAHRGRGQADKGEPRPEELRHETCGVHEGLEVRRVRHGNVVFMASMLPEYGKILISASDNKGVDIRSEILFRCNAGPRHKLTPRSEQPGVFLLPDSRVRSTQA